LILATDFNDYTDLRYLYNLSVKEKHLPITNQLKTIAYQLYIINYNNSIGRIKKIVN